jgi:CubicO group peptidase (beta-lactamase class C family)
MMVSGTPLAQLLEEYVAARWTMHGTHTGEFNGIPAAGKPVNLAGFAWHARFVNFLSLCAPRLGQAERHRG